MKYIFLFTLLIISTGVSAQSTSSFGGSRTDPNYYTTGAGSANGGEIQTGAGSQNGGELQTATGSANGGQIQTGAGSSNGGKVPKLPEVEKPNLTITGISNWFVQILNNIGIILFSLALVVFLYGVFMLMFVGGTKDESRSKGKKFMFWGIVSLFVMTSTWGLVNVLKSSVFGSTGPLLGPQFK